MTWATNWYRKNGNGGLLMHDNANGFGSCCSSGESAVTDPFDAYVVLSVSIPQGQQWIFRKFYLRRSPFGP